MKRKKEKKDKMKEDKDLEEENKYKEEVVEKDEGDEDKDDDAVNSILPFTLTETSAISELLPYSFVASTVAVHE